MDGHLSLELTNPNVSHVERDVLVQVQEEVSRISDNKVTVKCFQVSTKKDVQKNMKISETTKQLLCNMLLRASHFTKEAE